MFRRVDAKVAGPTAIGVLVPHGKKTLVVIRMRAMPWDLLPAQWDGDAAVAPRFCSFSRDDAAATARRFITDLQAAAASGDNPVQTFGNAAIGKLQIWVRTANLVWIACERTVGKAYEPATFASHEDAVKAATKIGRCVFPPDGEVQEYYFNTQSFA